MLGFCLQTNNVPMTTQAFSEQVVAKQFTLLHREVVATFNPRSHQTEWPLKSAHANLTRSVQSLFYDMKQ